MKLNEVDTNRKELDLKFEYLPAAEHLKAGFVSDHINAYLDGKKVGYLKIDRIDKELFHKECPDIWAFKQEYEGKHLWKDTTLPIADKPFPELVSALRSGFMHRYVNYWGKQMKWAPEQIEIIDKIANDYKSSPSEWEQYRPLVVKFFKDWNKSRDGKETIKKMNDKLAYLTKPFVAYINTKESKHQGVDADNSGKGIGTALYIAGSNWIRERGLGKGLYASSIQSNDAKAIWKKFESKGMVATDGERRYLKA